MERAKIYDLTSRLEKWSEPVNVSSTFISVSSHGRVKIVLEGRTKVFSFIESIKVLDTMVQNFKDFGYQVF